MWYFFIYLSGVLVCNAVLDTLVLLNRAKVYRPTFIGALLVMCEAHKLSHSMEMKSRVGNVISSLLFSWMWAVPGLCILFGMVLFGKKN